MAQQKTTKQGCKASRKGFTIIEVVLVLAIAGLIFLMVFIALPALQSAQRNTQRQEDISRFLTAVTDFQSNNSGRLPFTFAAGGAMTVDVNFVSRYIDNTCPGGNTFMAQQAAGTCTADQFRDPDGTLYFFNNAQVNNAANVDGSFDVILPNATTNNHIVYVVTNAMCGANEGTVVAGSGAGGFNAVNSRQVALLMILEGGGITCNANS